MVQVRMRRLGAKLRRGSVVVQFGSGGLVVVAG